MYFLSGHKRRSVMMWGTAAVSSDEMKQEVHGPVFIRL